jgi:hypothetical protein
MEKNTNLDDYIEYYNYVKEEMIKINSSGSKLALDRINKEINQSKLDTNDVRKLCELVQFIQISENPDGLALYHEWWRYIKKHKSK